jgi:hypothetical protein
MLACIVPLFAFTRFSLSLARVGLFSGKSRCLLVRFPGLSFFWVADVFFLSLMRTGRNNRIRYFSDLTFDICLCFFWYYFRYEQIRADAILTARGIFLVWEII